MFSTTFKRRSSPSRSSAGSSSQQRRPAQAAISATDGTSNTLTYAVVADSDRRQTADGQGGAVDANGFVVDGPFSVRPASGFSWSETQTGTA